MSVTIAIIFENDLFIIFVRLWNILTLLKLWVVLTLMNIYL